MGIINLSGGLKRLPPPETGERSNTGWII